MRKLLILFFLLIGAVAIAQNQEVERIRRTPDFIYAEGEGMFLEDADKEALRLLSSQIWTFVVSETTSSASTLVESGRITEEREQLATFDKSFTASTIPNARMLIIAEEPECRVLRYVSKSDVEAMLNAKSERIIDFVNAGKRAEQQLQIDDALRNYYWALMLAKSHPRAVYVDIGGRKVECRRELFDKIKQVIGSITENVETCETAEGITKVTMRFRYDGNDVASLQFRYDAAPGERVGPITVKNGIAEIDVRQLPDDGKLLIQYEYRFAKEAANLDKELEAVFSATTHPKGIDSRSFVNRTDMLASNGKKKKKDRSKADETTHAAAETADTSFAPEPYRQRDIREFVPASNTEALSASMTKIEEAIKAKSPMLARDCFSDDGFVFFKTLLQKTGTVSLVGKQEYEFVDAGSQILARYCKAKIKFRDGRQFMENIVFRFNPVTYKVESLAFGLTKVAEECILNARSSWSEVSAFTILRFMEDYQTAYALKRIDYIENLFSEHAIIISGSVLSPTKGHFENSIVFGDDENVRYEQYTRQQYIDRLRNVIFKNNEYVHLTFEDNITGIVNTNGMLPVGSAFAIQIRQIYNSEKYSDRGYLTLFLNMQGSDPIIEVRLWQAERDGHISYTDFIKKFNIQ